MELKFDPNQEYQVRAVNAAAGLLEGQPHRNPEPSFGSGGVAVVPNRRNLTPDALLENLRMVQEDNGLAPDEELLRIEAEVETASGKRTVSFPNFSVEMETGTGKTYVYIRTALELHRRYGLSKFIIVVPSIAIREGVLKTFEVTRRHFAQHFDNVPYSYYAYNSEKLNQVRQFARSPTVQFLVMTMDAFNKAGNRIHQSQDSLFGSIPIQELQAAHPILILDEPQNMKTDLAKRSLAALNPLLALRYSATHAKGEVYNLIYRLTPYDAYRQGLVKKIAVASVIKENDANQVFVRLDSIEAKGANLTAKVALHKRTASGEAKETVVTVRDGDELEGKAKRPEYAGYRVAEISKAEGFVRFSNDVELRIGDSKGGDREAILREQIRYTVREHIRRQERLRSHGVKVLSLFFVDQVDNYAPIDAPLRRMFEEAFNEHKEAYPEWKDKDPESVQAAYFASKRKKGGQVEYLDTRGDSQADVETYSLIMKRKEALLSFDEPTCFIFSHSALKEGWDNPNVFQVCTLRNVGSELQRRQQVGRGMRLAVDQDGERVLDDGVNLLTVVANEAYEQYVEGLQSEIRAEYGDEGVPPKPPRADIRPARLQSKMRDSEAFQELWKKIQRRTKYSVKLDSDKVIQEAVEALEDITIPKPRITITKAEVGVEDDEDELLTRRGGSEAVEIEQRWKLPNLVAVMADLMEHTTPPVKITRRTLLEIVRRLPDKTTATANPQEFATVAAQKLKEVLGERLVKGVHYQPLEAVWSMELFDQEWQEFMEAVGTPKNGLYDQVFVQGGVERRFAEDLENTDEVQVFVKLPRWFVIETPVGTYNPDWAVVWQDLDASGEPTGKPHLYLIAETKGSTIARLRAQEEQKVHCGTKHFEALDVPYEVVQSAQELAQRAALRLAA